MNFVLKQVHERRQQDEFSCKSAGLVLPLECIAISVYSYKVAAAIIHNRFISLLRTVNIQVLSTKHGVQHLKNSWTLSRLHQIVISHLL